MPTYQYRCQDCSRDLEIFQKFTDDALTVCPECDGSLRKVFNAVGVVFKGSGFYKTDSRASNGTNGSGSDKSTSSSSSSGDSTSSSSGSSTGSASSSTASA